MDVAVARTECRAHGAALRASASGALRPLRLRSMAQRFAIATAPLSLRGSETLPIGRLPEPLRSRRPRPANGSIRWLPDVAIIPPCRASRALATAAFDGSASLAIIPRPLTSSLHLRYTELARCGFVYTNRRSSDSRTQTILPPRDAVGLRATGAAPSGAPRTPCAARANRALRRSRTGLAATTEGGLPWPKGTTARRRCIW